VKSGNIYLVGGAGFNGLLMNFTENGTQIIFEENYWESFPMQDEDYQWCFAVNGNSYISEDSIVFIGQVNNITAGTADLFVTFRGKYMQTKTTPSITWERQETASGYIVDIYKATGELVYTLEFDAAGGTYKDITLKSGTLKTTEEFSFDASTLDLEKNATYYYTISALNGEEKVQIKEGVFTLNDDTPTAVQTLPSTTPTVVGYYNIIGQRLVGEPHKGLYIIRYNDGTSTKVVR
jgi:hypothetical protein